MKRLSQKQRLRLIRKSREGQRRRNRGALLIARMQYFYGATDKFPKTKEVRVGRDIQAVLEAPEQLSLTDNFAETLGFIYAARRLLYLSGGSHSRIPWKLDFQGIKKIGPAASLVLAAELHRWTTLSGRPPRAFVETWQPAVRAALHDLGLLPLLGLPQFDQPGQHDASGLKFLPFKYGRLTRGENAEQLRNDLEELSGRRITAPQAIYGALCEAMTNVRQHAYKYHDAAWPAPYVYSWWATGAYDESSRTIRFFVYDQGVGIPRTLPRSKLWTQVAPILSAFGMKPGDAELIDSAIQARRSSTLTPGRGRGLDEIVSYIDAEGRGRLRILSGNGEVVYMPNRKRTRRNLPGRLIGTLIEWEISDSA